MEVNKDIYAILICVELGSVTGLVANNVTMTSALLSWNGAVGASYYQIYYKQTGTLTMKLLGTVQDTSFIVTGLKSSTSFTFQVVPGDVQFYPNLAAQLIASTLVIAFNL